MKIVVELSKTKSKIIPGGVVTRYQKSSKIFTIQKVHQKGDQHHDENETFLLRISTRRCPNRKTQVQPRTLKRKRCRQHEHDGIVKSVDLRKLKPYQLNTRLSVF